MAIVVGERAEFANDMYVSPGFFTVFGQAPAAGRLLTERDVPAGDADPAVAVVRHHWAESHFGSAHAAVGKTIRVYGMAMEIVGVAAPGFSYPDATDLWAPLGTSGTNRSAASLPRRRQAPGRGGRSRGPGPRCGPSATACRDSIRRTASRP